ncbi:MAG TPA: FecR family protein [bacterium]|mgnify:CR=1 FL=1|nr:MAG: FecR protein [bacterium ADurb.Bin236]HOY65135.1 FecR family protein [bacterium]HPI78792.1 FecR family protein [bacterium]
MRIVDGLLSRRDFLSVAMTAGAMSAAGIIVGSRAFPAEPELKNRLAGKIIKIKGDIRVNGNPIKAGIEVFDKDILTTGNKSQAWAILDNAIAAQFNQNTLVSIHGNIPPEANSLKGLELNLVSGSVLAQTRKFDKAEEYPFVVRTPVATAGVRGTTFYVEHMSPEKTYICACYKEVTFTPAANPGLAITKNVSKHTAYIINAPGDGNNEIFNPAGLIGHDDYEIEALRKALKKETGHDSEYPRREDSSY